MKNHQSKYLIVFFLAAMFAAPGITAYIFFQHPSWLGAATVNKGRLLSPPSVLSALTDQKKWRIVFWSPTDCEQSCRAQLDILARVRLALGRKLYYVDQWLVLGSKASSLSKEDMALLKEQDFHVIQLSQDETEKMSNVSSIAQVYLANPDKFLVLSYQATVEPDDVYKDLKLLLNTTENKSG